MLNMAEGVAIPPRTVLLICPENPLLMRVGSQMLRADMGLLVNVGADCTPAVGALLQRARRDGGAETFLWVKHSQCVALNAEAVRVGAGTSASPCPAGEFERAVAQLVGSGAVEGYRVVVAALWDDVSHELRVIETRELSSGGGSPLGGSAAGFDS